MPACLARAHVCIHSEGDQALQDQILTDNLNFPSPEWDDVSDDAKVMPGRREHVLNPKPILMTSTNAQVTDSKSRL